MGARSRSQALANQAILTPGRGGGDGKTRKRKSLRELTNRPGIIYFPQIGEYRKPGQMVADQFLSRSRNGFIGRLVVGFGDPVYFFKHDIFLAVVDAAVHKVPVYDLCSDHVVHHSMKRKFFPRSFPFN